MGILCSKMQVKYGAGCAEMDDLKLFIALSRTMLHVDRSSQVIFRAHGLTKGQFAVLEVLYHKGELTSKQIKELILTTPGNLPVIIHNLEKEGFVSRREDPRDRRSSLLSLTPLGTKKIEEVFPENKELIEQLFSVWTKEEKEQMMRALLKYRKEHYAKER